VLDDSHGRRCRSRHCAGYIYCRRILLDVTKYDCVSVSDASESLKKMLGEPKQLFADPVHRNQQPSSHGVSPDAAASVSAAAAAAAAAVPMDAKPSGPYNHSLFAS